jgi:hypothetical protein
MKMEWLPYQDNGIGIDLDKHGAKLLNKTFHDHPDAKVQACSSLKSSRNNGGIIYAESKVDQGTKFIIYFNVNNSLNLKKMFNFVK